MGAARDRISLEKLEGETVFFLALLQKTGEFINFSVYTICQGWIKGLDLFF